MQIHVPTLFFLMCGVSLLASAKMASEWRQHQGGSTALLYWSFGCLGVAMSSFLTTLRPYGYLDLSIGLSNALLFLGYALIWKGVAVFAGRRAPWPLVLAGSMLWAIAWCVPAFANDVTRRIALGSALIVAYCLATGICLLRERTLRTARQAGTVFLLHGAVYLLRLAALPFSVTSADPLQINNGPLAAVIFEGVLFLVVACYLLLAVTRERGEQLLIAAAETDYLTGVLNRRAFTERARRMLGGETAKPGATLLLFDLDHFKAINDRHGHAVGDAVLVLFCRVVEGEIEPTDLFGRLGGEEFAAVLPGPATETARLKAETIVRVFAEKARDFAARPLGATVSIGLATARPGADIDAVLADADADLYAAKQAGRNRVSGAASTPVDVPPRASALRTISSA